MPPCDANGILPLKNPIAAIRLINSFNPDLVVDFAQWPRISAVLLALSKAKFTVGFKTKDQYRHFCYDRVVGHNSKIHEFDNFANLLASVGVPRPAWPQLTLSAIVCERIDALALRSFVVCHPWAAGVKHEMREWPADCWRRLAKVLIERGYDVVFTGGPDDVGSTSDLLAGFPNSEPRIFNCAGLYSLEETAVLLARATAVVSVNTGIMHIAAAVSAVLVGLHGPTDPHRWGPLSNRAISLSADTPNSGYLNLGFEYPRNAQPCMQHIEVDAVLKSIAKLTHFPS